MSAQPNARRTDVSNVGANKTQHWRAPAFMTGLQQARQAATRQPHAQPVAHILFWQVGFASMDFLSAVTPQVAVLGLGALVLLVVTFVLVSLAVRE